VSARLSNIEQQIAHIAAAIGTSSEASASDGPLAMEPPASGVPSYAQATARNAGAGGRVVFRPASQEAEDEKHRRCLVIRGLPENGRDLVDASNLCRHLDPAATIVEVFRMGMLPGNDAANRQRQRQQQQRPRLLKVRFSASTVARSVLQQASNLKDIRAYKGVFIRRSMPEPERKQQSALRSAAFDLNQEAEKNPDNDLHYAVVSEKLVLFRNCERVQDRLIGGNRSKLTYEFVETDGKISVQVN
jgi:hypothetical protein